MLQNPMDVDLSKEFLTKLAEGGDKNTVPRTKYDSLVKSNRDTIAKINEQHARNLMEE